MMIGNRSVSYNCWFDCLAAKYLGMHIPFLQQFLSLFRGLLFFSVVGMAGIGTHLKATGFFYEIRLDSLREEGYRHAIHRLLKQYEEERGEEIVPGERGKVALKLDTRRGLGLAPAVGLVRSLIAELELRGFDRKNIFLVDQREYSMRHAGFLPPLSDGGIDFEGSPVYSWYSWRFIDPIWYYDNALRGEVPPSFVSSVWTEGEEELVRSSFLPILLIDEVDFWINLPVIAHFPPTGFSGALANASLFNVTNEERFFRNPVNAPVAIAEINAIPELKENMLFTLVSLERYQFEGGPLFNANYSDSEWLLWMSTDPVALDAAALGKVNRARQRRGFKPFEVPHPVIDYAEQLGVGKASLPKKSL